MCRTIDDDESSSASLSNGYSHLVLDLLVCAKINKPKTVRLVSLQALLVLSEHELDWVEIG